MSTQNRFTDKQDALDILMRGSLGILATVSPDGEPYAPPVHYCFSKEENCVFFHCATQGRKIDNILFCPHVSFVVVGPYEVILEKTTTRYESVMLFGKAKIIEDPVEKAEKLRALCKKFAPASPWASNGAPPNTCSKSHIVKISADHVTGKRSLP